MNWYKKAVNLIDPSPVEYTSIGHGSFSWVNENDSDKGKIRNENYSWLWNGERLNIKPSGYQIHEDIFGDDETYKAYYRGRVEKRAGREKISVTIYPNYVSYPSIKFKEIPEELINALVNKFGNILEIHVIRN